MKLGELIPELQVSDYSRLCRRFKNLEIKISESEDEVHAAVDSIGVKETNHSKWIRKYHNGKRREWIKVHDAVDRENKELLSIEVADEKIGGSEVLQDLVEDIDLKDCLGNGAYYAEEIFKIPEEEEEAFARACDYNLNRACYVRPPGRTDSSLNGWLTLLSQKQK